MHSKDGNDWLARLQRLDWPMTGLSRIGSKLGWMVSGLELVPYALSLFDLQFSSRPRPRSRSRNSQSFSLFIRRYYSYFRVIHTQTCVIIVTIRNYFESFIEINQNYFQDQTRLNSFALGFGMTVIFFFIFLLILLDNAINNVKSFRFGILFSRTCTYIIQKYLEFRIKFRSPENRNKKLISNSIKNLKIRI